MFIRRDLKHSLVSLAQIKHLNEAFVHRAHPVYVERIKLDALNLLKLFKPFFLLIIERSLLIVFPSITNQKVFFGCNEQLTRGGRKPRQCVHIIINFLELIPGLFNRLRRINLHQFPGALSQASQGALTPVTCAS